MAKIAQFHKIAKIAQIADIAKIVKIAKIVRSKVSRVTDSKVVESVTCLSSNCFYEIVLWEKQGNLLEKTAIDVFQQN